MPFDELIRLDMDVRFPSLLSPNDKTGDREIARVDSLLEWFRANSAPGIGHTDEYMPLVNGKQMESLRNGPFVSQEVFSIVLQLMCRWYHIDFLQSPSHVTSITAGPESPDLAGSRTMRWLVLSTDLADALQFFYDTRQPGKSSNYCQAVAQNMNRYEGICVPFCYRNIYSLVTMVNEAGGKEGETRTTVTVSSGAFGNLPKYFQDGLKMICDFQNYSLVAAKGHAGHIQGSPGSLSSPDTTPDSLFHTISSIFSTVTELPLPADSRKNDAMLRRYAELVLLEDWNKTGNIALDMDAEFPRWMAEIPEDVVKEDAGGSGVSGSSQGGGGGASAAAASSDPSHHPAPFYGPLLPGSPTPGSPTPAPMLEHVLNTVVQLFGEVLTANGLPLSTTLDGVSSKHLAIMNEIMADLRNHRQILDEKLLPLQVESWNRLKPGEMLDDHVVDVMTNSIAVALGAYTPGGEVKDPSKLLKTPERAGNYLVLKVADAHIIRMASGTTQSYGAAQGPINRAGTNSEDALCDPDILEMRPDDAESQEKAVARAIRLFAGQHRASTAQTLQSNHIRPESPAESREKAEAARAIRLIAGKDRAGAVQSNHQEPFLGRNILMVHTNTVSLHTTVAEMTQRSIGAWTICEHDSLTKSRARLDERLRLGLQNVLQGLDLKKSNFRYTDSNPFVPQGLNQCALIATVRLIVILTGESLDVKDWQTAAEILRIFYDAWLYRIAENKGAIATGYLQRALSSAVAAVLAAGGTACNVAGQRTFFVSDSNSERPDLKEHQQDDSELDTVDSDDDDDGAESADGASVKSELSSVSSEDSDTYRREKNPLRPLFDSEVGMTVADRAKMAQEAHKRVVNQVKTDIPNLDPKENLKELLVLIRNAPFDAEISKVSRLNGSNAFEMISRQTLYRAARYHEAAREATQASTWTSRVDAKGGEQDRQWRIQLAEKALGHVICTLAASFIAELAEFRELFISWLFTTFRPACSRLFQGEAARLLNPLNEAIESHRLLAPCDTLSDRCVDARQTHDAKSGSASSGTGIISPFEQYKNLRGRCHICKNLCGSKLNCSHWTCACGVQCCRACSGVALNVNKKVLEKFAYACDQCLHGFHASNTGKTLLIPSPSFKLCCQCGCDLTLILYCERAARCGGPCERPFCSECTALTDLDFTRKSKNKNRAVEKSREVVALIECKYCVSHKAYASGRRALVFKLIRKLFSNFSGNSLDIPMDKMMIMDLRANKEQAIAISDLVFGLRYNGFRELFTECLPFLMTLSLKQISIGQTVSVQPFHMLLYSRTNTPGSISPADGMMLEKICLSHTAEAIKAGDGLLALLENDLRQPRPALDPTQRCKVIVYSYDLLKLGPLSNLVAEALSVFAQDSRFDVWICGEGPPDLQYNVVKELHDDFKDRGRLLLFNGDAKPIDKLLLFLSVGPHAVLSFPGWTCGDLAEVLYALNQLNVKIFNTLGYAGPMHFPEGITCTIVGPAVGRVQKSSQTREPLAIFGDRESYQPPQSKLKPPDQLSGWSKTEARRTLNLPLDAFIAVVPMKLDRLEQESILYYINYLQRTENSCVVFVLRAKSMREQIEEWIASSCASPDIRSRFLFRSAFPNTDEFSNLLCAGDASLDSLSNFSAHTTAQDAIDSGLGHFSKNDPEGLMQSRVGAEVSIAAGLEHVCVGKTGQETIDFACAVHEGFRSKRTYQYVYCCESKRKDRTIQRGQGPSRLGGGYTVLYVRSER